MAGAADFSLTPVINSAAFAEVYEQKEEVGAGAFSRVYRATQRATGKDFACKVVKKDHPDYDDAEMESEIRIARMVAGHPNVANIVDVFVDETRWYLVQELVMGGELFDIVIRRSEAREEATAGADARPYTEQEASLVVRQVLQALTHCHAKGVAHRDIKPENVLCDSTAVDSLLKLGDFGLAKIIPPDGIMTASSGTPEYVAPEVIARPPVGYGPGCDIWSVGVLTYILLCGFPPFYGDSPKDILASVKSRVVDFSADFFPSPEWDDISAEAKHLLVKGMLNRDPTQRLTALQLLEHPWLAANTNTAPLQTMARLKRFNAKRKLRAAYHAMRATNRMAALIRDMKATATALAFAQTYSLEDVENIYDELEEVSERSGGAIFLGREAFGGALAAKLPGDAAAARATAAGHWDAFAKPQAGLNYQEYVLALSMMFAQTPEEKLRFAFEICDRDANGVVDQSEFCDLIFNILAGVNGSINQALINETSRVEFSKADTDGDGVLSVAEFVVAGQQQPQLQRYFMSLERLTRAL